VIAVPTEVGAHAPVRLIDERRLAGCDIDRVARSKNNTNQKTAPPLDATSSMPEGDALEWERDDVG
jgi:hypothetical protein